MSLIITSSNQSDLNDGNIATEKAFAYRNNFSNPIKVKKNGKVAVQSVKITREALFDIGETDTMGLYFGDEIGASDLSLVTSRVVPISLVGDIMRQSSDVTSQSNLSFSPADMADRLSSVLTNQIYFPDVINTKVDVTIKKNITSKSFEGFNITFEQKPHDAALNNISASFVTYWKGNEGSFTYDSINKIFKRTAPSAAKFGKKAFATGIDYPLSLNNGKFTIDISKLSVGTDPGGGAPYVVDKFANWRVGLSRPTGNTNITSDMVGDSDFINVLKGFNDEPPSISRNTDFYDHHFYDYVVQYHNGVLSVWQNATTDARPNNTTMVKINYVTHSSLTEKITATNWKTNVWDSLTFIATGEQLELSIHDSVKNLDVLLISPSLNTGKQFNFVPIRQTTWFLFPRFHLTKKDDEIEITQFSGVNLSLPNRYEAYYNRSFYTLCSRNTLPQLNEGVITSIDTSPLINQSVPTIKTLTKLNGANGIDFKWVLLFGSSRQYATTNDSLYKFNTSKIMGFDGLSVIEQSVFGSIVAGDANVCQFVSIDRPELASNKTICVRVNTLSVESLNGATGSVSKILMVLPKFDNTGSEFGSLFFDSKELVYLDLNNSDEVILSDISVDLVNIDEKYARGLTGNTIVTFVIKN
tara:strand:+ start:413 stop:2335 length:1923 start_codon:yes stop_codon:yes gene_type:complete